MRRVFICDLCFFPRGGARSNYLQYFADALTSVGYQVELLSGINKEYSDTNEMIFHEIHVSDIYYHGRNPVLSRLMNGLFFKIRLKKRLVSFNLNSSDLIVFSSVAPIVNPIYDLKKKYHFKTASTPLEWFPSSFYSNKKDAVNAEKMFRLNSHNDVIFPISHKICDQFPDNVSLVLPCMTDTKEFEYVSKNNGKYIFVFPANGLMKDAFSEMIHGILMLSDQDLEKMELHITGVTEERIKDIISDANWSRVSHSIIIHKWMEYAELVSLYQKAHFLFLAREKNQMTESNFPSKVPETMTYGIVPVVSKVGDYTQYYLKDSVNSIVFDGCDRGICKEILHRAINISFENYLELSNNARKCAEERFDYRNWAIQIKDTIESVY